MGGLGTESRLLRPHPELCRRVAGQRIRKRAPAKRLGGVVCLRNAAADIKSLRRAARAAHSQAKWRASPCGLHLFDPGSGKPRTELRRVNDEARPVHGVMLALASCWPRRAP